MLKIQYAPPPTLPESRATPQRTAQNPGTERLVEPADSGFKSALRRRTDATQQRTGSTTRTDDSASRQELTGTKADSAQDSKAETSAGDGIESHGDEKADSPHGKEQVASPTTRQAEGDESEAIAEPPGAEQSEQVENDAPIALSNPESAAIPIASNHVLQGVVITGQERTPSPDGIREAPSAPRTPVSAIEGSRVLSQDRLQTSDPDIVSPGRDFRVVTEHADEGIVRDSESKVARVRAEAAAGVHSASNREEVEQLAVRTPTDVGTPAALTQTGAEATANASRVVQDPTSRLPESPASSRVAEVSAPLQPTAEALDHQGAQDGGADSRREPHASATSQVSIEAGHAERQSVGSRFEVNEASNARPEAPQPATPAAQGAAEVASRVETVNQRAGPAQPATLASPLGAQIATDDIEAPFQASVSRAVSAVVRQQGGSLTVRLSPPMLGSLKIEMVMDRGVVEARFETTTAQAQELLTNNLAQLKSTLESRGLSVEKLSVQTVSQAAHGSSAATSEQDASSDEHQRQGSGQHDAGDGRSRGGFDRSFEQEARRSDQHDDGWRPEDAGDESAEPSFDQRVRLRLNAIA